MKIRIFWRLFWPVFFVLALFAAAVDWTGRSTVTRMVLDETRESLIAIGRVWQSRLGAGATPAELAVEARRLGNDRLTLISSDGTVLADSVADSSSMENHRNRPEVAAVLAQPPPASGEDVRRSATTRDEYLYLALPPPPGGTVVIRVASQLRAIAAIERDADLRLRYGLLWALLAALLVAAAFSWPLAWALARLKEGAEAVAAGSSPPNWPAGGGREVQAVADAMASTASQWRREIDSRQQLADERRAILDAIAEAVIGLDEKGRVIYANPAAFKLHQQLRLHPPDAETLYANLFPHPQLIELLRRPPPGNLLLERAAPPAFRLEVFTAATGENGRLLILRDLTAAEKLRAIKQELTANVSHELKTPLAAILGAVETLEDENLTTDQRRQFVSLASRHARRLKDLLDDLMTLARLEQPGLVPDMQPLTAQALAEDAALAIRPLADGAALQIVLEAEGELLGDRRQLHQALVNYLTNAIRHSPAGLAVAVRVERTGALARMIVADRGAGVPDAIKDRVFERFFRGDSARDRESGGTGLGLAIAKHVAQLHGGRAWVEDNPGGGARFILEWPQPESPD